MVPRRIRRTLAGLILAWSSAVLPTSAEAGWLRLGSAGEGSRFAPRSFFAVVWDFLTDLADIDTSDPVEGDNGGDQGMEVDPNG